MLEYNLQFDQVGGPFGVLEVSKRGIVDDLDVSVPRGLRPL
jgi:hypothetical protein